MRGVSIASVSDAVARTNKQLLNTAVNSLSPNSANMAAMGRATTNRAVPMLWAT